MADYTISIYHDTRYTKRPKKKEVEEIQPSSKNTLYPVKLRVYFNYEPRLYPIGINLTKEDFERSYLAEKPRKEFKDLKTKIEAQKVRADAIATELKPFSFALFEKRLLRKRGSGTDAFYHYEEIIKGLDKNEKIKTASNYNLSMQSIITYLFYQGKYKQEGDKLSSNEAFKQFCQKQTIAKALIAYYNELGKRIELPLDEITVDFLKDYQKWMTGKGYSKTTISMYLRALRTVFNTAIREENLPKDLYPFGKTKFKIPGGRKVKKALNKSSLKTLFGYEVPEGSHMEKARDLWLFTYLANGMNVRDLCNLKGENDHGTSIIFYRHKIEDTVVEDAKPIIIPITEKLRQLTNKYGNNLRSKDAYLFPFFNNCKNEKDRVRETENLVRYINQHIKRLAKLAGVTTEISCNWARHSFTTMAINSGASMEFVQDSLGHQNIKTTMNYWGGFEENVKKDIANKLMDFED